MCKYAPFHFHFVFICPHGDTFQFHRWSSSLVASFASFYSTFMPILHYIYQTFAEVHGYLFSLCVLLFKLALLVSVDVVFHVDMDFCSGVPSRVISPIILHTIVHLASTPPPPWFFQTNLEFPFFVFASLCFAVRDPFKCDPCYITLFFQPSPRPHFFFFLHKHASK